MIEKTRGKVKYLEKNGDIVAKQCTCCIEMKALNEFNGSKTGLFGKTSRCKTCISALKTMDDLNRTEEENKKIDKSKRLTRYKKYKKYLMMELGKEV